jgi:hypothetical protein
MKRIIDLSSLALVLGTALGAAATGCATDPADASGDLTGAGDEPGDDGVTAAAPGAAGTYRLQSKLDLAASVPGTAGQVVSKILEITDGPDDPTRWILDQAIAAMPSGYLRSALQRVEPYVAGYLNDRLLDLAPGFVPVALQLAQDLGQMARGFGLVERLEVSGAPGAYAAALAVVGAHFTVGGVESDHAFADHGLPEPAAAVSVTLAAGKLGIGEHRASLSYGRLLRLGLDAAIVPMLEPGANSLNELFAAKANCALIGQAIAAAVGLGGASTYAAACTAGLDRGADYIYSKLAAIDGTALELGLAGAARAIDKDRDGSVDTLATGAWTGTVSYGGALAPLAGATFFGARM